MPSLMRSTPLIPFRMRLRISVKDAVQVSSLSRAELYRQMRSGKLKFTKAGSRRLIVVPSLLELIGEPTDVDAA
jgi:hypothetical protein